MDNMNARSIHHIRRRYGLKRLFASLVTAGFFAFLFRKALRRWYQRLVGPNRPTPLAESRAALSIFQSQTYYFLDTLIAVVGNSLQDRTAADGVSPILSVRSTHNEVISTTLNNFLARIEFSSDSELSRGQLKQKLKSLGLVLTEFQSEVGGLPS